MSPGALAADPEVGAWGLLAAGAGGVAFGALLYHQLARRALAAMPVEPEPPRPWTWREGLLAVGAQLLLMVAVSLAASPFVDGAELGPLASLVLSALVQGGVVAVLFAVARRQGPRAAFGLRLERPGPVARCALGYWAASLPLLYGCSMVWAGLWLLATGALPIQGVSELMGRAEGLGLVLSTLLGVLVIPVLEELIFRGALMGLLARYFSPLATLVASSAIFALLHGWVAFGPIFVLALLMGTVYQRSRSLVAPIVLHVMNNGLQFLFLHLGGPTP